jgi:hypothetical protein
MPHHLQFIILGFFMAADPVLDRFCEQVLQLGERVEMLAFSANVDALSAARIDSAVGTGHDGRIAADNARRLDVRAFDRPVVRTTAVRTVLNRHGG